MSLIPSTDNARPHTPVEYDPEEYGFDETDDIRIYEHHRIRVDPGQEPMRVDLFL